MTTSLYDKLYPTKPKKDPRYEGLNKCRQNVKKCNISNKLAYCKEK